VRGAQVYHLDEAAGPDFSAYAHRYVGPDLSFTLTDQPQGYWCYRVRAEGGPGGSADSNLACVWVCPCRSYAPLFQRSGRTQGIPGVRLGLERVIECVAEGRLRIAAAPPCPRLMCSSWRHP